MKKKTTAKQYAKNLHHRVSFRTSEAMWGWLEARAEKLGETPSSFVRNLVFQQMSTEALLAATSAENPNK